jgi:hypothetical protein
MNEWMYCGMCIVLHLCTIAGKQRQHAVYKQWTSRSKDFMLLPPPLLTSIQTITLVITDKSNHYSLLMGYTENRSHAPIGDNS